MNADLERVQLLLEPWAQPLESADAQLLNMVIEAENLLAGVRAIADDGWGYLTAITGLDPGTESGSLEVLYHFCRGAAVLALRVRIAREDAAIPSVCDVFPIATVYERELAEMFGINVVDTPDKRRLFLPDEWPSGVYPLRKDADLGKVSPRREEEK